MTKPPKEPEIQFKPLSAGLGFHPFSDGLPYAPVTKAQTPVSSSMPMGRGAVAAGPARPVLPARPTARMAVPTVARPTAPMPAPAPTPEPAAGAFGVETQYGFGYLFKRSLAYFTDTVLNTALCVTALSVALWNQNLSPEALISPGVVALCGLFLATFNWAVIAAQEVAFGTSVGKRLFGLVLKGGSSAVFLRAFFFVPSVAFCGIGLLWGLLDRKRRCWHDVAVDLQPTEIASL